MATISYYKTIEITDTGLIHASVWCNDGNDGRRVGYKNFASPFDSVHKRCVKAHKWADERISVCNLMEVPEALFQLK